MGFISEALSRWKQNLRGIVSGFRRIFRASKDVQKKEGRAIITVAALVPIAFMFFVRDWLSGLAFLLFTAFWYCGIEALAYAAIGE